VRLTHNEGQGGWLLLAPERVFKADAITAEILQRSTGEASMSEIVDDLARTFTGAPLSVSSPTRCSGHSPCRSCERREQDFGGCRCQAFLISGDARDSDPACHLSPHHARMAELAAVREEGAFAYRPWTAKKNRPHEEGTRSRAREVWNDDRERQARANLCRPRPYTATHAAA
jgi:hypothetical protein